MLAPFHYGSSFNSRILCGAVSYVGILLTLSHREHKGVHTFLCSIAFERRLARHSCSCVVIVFTVKEWCKVLWPPWVPTTSMFSFLLFTKGLSFLKISIGLSYGVRTRRTRVVCVPDLSFNYTFTFGIWSDVVCESSKLLLGCLSSSHLYFQRVKRKKGTKSHIICKVKCSLIDKICESIFIASFLAFLKGEARFSEKNVC